MSLHYFHFIDSRTHIDADGLDFPDLEAARQAVVTTIREIAAELVLKGVPITNQRIQICNEDGKVLDTIVFRSVILN